MGSRSRLWLVLVGLLALASGCAPVNGSPEPSVAEFATNASKVFVHQGGSGLLSFNLVLFSRQKISHVDVSGIDVADQDSSDFDVTVENNDFGGIENRSYRGWHTKVVLVTITAPTGITNYEVAAMRLVVDGTPRNVEFTTHLVLADSGGNIFADAFQGRVLPNGFGSEFINAPDQTALYRFTATEDLVLTDVYLPEFITIGSMAASIDQSSLQEARLPLSLRAGQELYLELSFSSHVADEQSYVATTLFFDFTLTGTEERKTNGVSIEFDPISPLSEGDYSKIDRLIDSFGLG